MARRRHPRRSRGGRESASPDRRPGANPRASRSDALRADASVGTRRAARRGDVELELVHRLADRTLRPRRGHDPASVRRPRSGVGRRPRRCAPPGDARSTRATASSAPLASRVIEFEEVSRLHWPTGCADTAAGRSSLARPWLSRTWRLRACTASPRATAARPWPCCVRLLSGRRGSRAPRGQLNQTSWFGQAYRRARSSLAGGIGGSACSEEMPSARSSRLRCTAFG